MYHLSRQSLIFTPTPTHSQSHWHYALSPSPFRRSGRRRVDTAELRLACCRPVHHEREVCWERTRIKHSTICVTPLVLVSTICENKHIRQRIDAQSMVVAPVYGTRREWQWAEVRLVANGLHKVFCCFARCVTTQGHQCVAPHFVQNLFAINNDLLGVEANPAWVACKVCIRNTVAYFLSKVLW